jgi:hypothetical protein
MPGLSFDDKYLGTDNDFGRPPGMGLLYIATPGTSCLYLFSVLSSSSSSSSLSLGDRVVGEDGIGIRGALLVLPGKQPSTTTTTTRRKSRARR